MVYFGNTPVKIEKVASHHSLLKTDSNQFLKKEERDLKSELNKTKVYLLTTQKAKKKQLLLIQPESRLDTEKSLVDKRHRTILTKVKSQKRGGPPKNQREAREKNLAFKLPKPKIDSNGIWLNNLAGELEEQRNIVRNPYKVPEMANKIGKYRKQVFRNNQSYFTQEKTNRKAICPVFFDKLSAEEFLLQTSDFSSFEKNTNSKKSIIESYNHLLKVKEVSNQEFLEKLTSYQEELNLQNLNLKEVINSSNQNLKDIESVSTESKPNFALRFLKKHLIETKSFFKKHLIQRKIRRLEDLKTNQIITYGAKEQYFKKTFNNYEETFESLKSFSKNTKENKISKQVAQAKVISVGLGDLIDSYSSLPKMNDLKYLEFLFFPKMDEEKNFVNEKPLVTVFGKKMISGGEKINSNLTSKTFKTYQKEYFENL